MTNDSALARAVASFLQAAAGTDAVWSDERRMVSLAYKDLKIGDLRRLAKACDEVMKAEEPGGWRCFHCNELFIERRAAQDHFGLSDVETPACVAMITEGEKAILEGRAEWRARALEAEDENEKIGCELNGWKWVAYEILKRHGHASDVRMEVDSLRGQILALKERVNWVPKWVRRLFTPKGYYP